MLIYCGPYAKERNRSSFHICESQLVHTTLNRVICRGVAVFIRNFDLNISNVSKGSNMVKPSPDDKKFLQIFDLFREDETSYFCVGKNMDDHQISQAIALFEENSRSHFHKGNFTNIKKKKVTINPYGDGYVRYDSRLRKNCHRVKYYDSAKTREKNPIRLKTYSTGCNAFIEIRLFDLFLDKNCSQNDGKLFEITFPKPLQPQQHNHCRFLH